MDGVGRPTLLFSEEHAIWRKILNLLKNMEFFLAKERMAYGRGVTNVSD
jgi:hypothetical protein